MNVATSRPRHRLQDILDTVIFGHETPTGRRFDVVLMVAIVASVLLVMLDSVRTLHDQYGRLFLWLEWGFTGLFTVEYGLRMYCARSRRAYATSFFGIVDLLSILPTYVSLLVPGSQYLLVIRILRVLRVYRVLKLVEYLGESELIADALRASRKKILVFLLGVLALAVALGSLMYVVEGEPNGFSSIPRSVYWAIVTLTTVGYGDISPQTNLGQVIAAVVMMLGYAIIAVPTGIVTAEFARQNAGDTGRRCPQCQRGNHRHDAGWCQWCGATLGD